RRLAALRHRFGVFAADCATVQENVVLKKAVSRIGYGKELKSEGSKGIENSNGEVAAVYNSSCLGFGTLQLDMPGPSLSHTLSKSPLSPSELQLLRSRFPSISILYEEAMEEQKKKADMKSKD